eukprot:CFRG1361T1
MWVTSYNILSSHLCEPSHFRTCDPEHLDYRNRQQIILKKLTPEIEKKSIICLQEVSRTFAGALHVHFAKHNYHFVTGLYGKRFNDYMGVGIAWSTDTYETVDVEVSKLSDSIKWGKEPAPGLLYESYKTLVNLATWPFKAITPASYWYLPDDPWKIAKSRENILVFVRLRSKVDGKTFCIANYHMPCVFWCPPVMMIHSALAARRTKTLAKEDPYILAGDFNFLPESPMYTMMTTGVIDKSDSTSPTVKPWIPYYPAVESPMTSAYAKVDGHEPDFTNYAQIKDQEPFIETLDYIFYSDGFEAESVKPLPKRSEVNGPLPIENEPSDHIMIAAEMTLR